VRAALEHGYLKNLEDRRGRPSRLVLGDPLPAEVTILPTVEDLERLHGCSGDERDGLAIEADYPRSAWGFDPDEDDPVAAPVAGPPAGGVS
jgi:hypothetical protein